jgi:hypothetical protein
MALETATYISDLVSTNPTSTDPKSQGDDHLRLLKSTVKATFPNVAGAVTPTHTELNYVDGVTSAIQGQIDLKGAIGGQTWTGSHVFPNTVTIGDISETEISYLNGVTSAIQTQFTNITGTLIPAKGAITGQTWTGAHDYTGATLTASTQSAGDSTTKVATTAFVMGTSFATALPSQTGNSGKFVTTDGSTASWASVSPSLVASSRTSNTILAESDRSTLIDVTSGTFTQTLTAAATLGSGWWCYYRNSGTGVVTFDPNGSETIDGATTGVLPSGMTILIQCTGSAFNCIRIGTIAKMEVLTSGTSWTCPLGVRRVRVRGVGGGGGTDNASSLFYGSSGGYFESVVTTVPSTAYTYAIGAGGSTTNPCTGGTTTWDSTLTGAGGTGGNAPTSGGAASGGQININGGSTIQATNAGAGGSNPLGCGGAGNIGSGTTTNATGYGAGAGIYSGATSKSGQQGVIILEY